MAKRDRLISLAISEINPHESACELTPSLQQVERREAAAGLSISDRVIMRYPIRT